MTFRMVGLTGGLAAGKTLVSRFIRAHGIPVINLDDIGREVTGPHLAAALKEATGQSLLKAGKIDRVALRDLVFSDPKIRARVEKVLHPVILTEFEKRCSDLKKQGKPIIVCEAALLVDSGHYQQMDELIVVTASEAVRKNRAMERDKLSQEFVEQIFAHQTSEAKKLKVATIVFRNEGTVEELKKQVDAWCEGVMKAKT